MELNHILPIRQFLNGPCLGDKIKKKRGNQPSIITPADHGWKLVGLVKRLFDRCGSIII